MSGYAELRRVLVDTFRLDPGSCRDRAAPVGNYYEFAYDWRQDSRKSAKRLADLVRTVLPRWRERGGAADARVILVAHSMGGLVARYFLEVLGGWEDCRALIGLGTPFRGSLGALGYLANGYRKLGVDLTEVVRALPSVHQLLPIYPALLSGETYRRVAEIPDLPGVDHTLATDALAFHRQIEEAVAVNQNKEPYRDRGYAVLPVVGCLQDTAQSATIDGGGVRISSAVPAWMDHAPDDGDGTVPRASAIPIELSDRPAGRFPVERHSALPRNREVLYELCRFVEMTQSRLSTVRKPAWPVDGARGPRRPGLAVDVPDICRSGEPVSVRVSLRHATRNGPLGLVGEVTAVDRGSAARTLPLEVAGGRDARLLLADCPPGRYRLGIGPRSSGPELPRPVHEVFEVVEGTPWSS